MGSMAISVQGHNMNRMQYIVVTACDTTMNGAPLTYDVNSDGERLFNGYILCTYQAHTSTKLF